MPTKLNCDPITIIIIIVLSLGVGFTGGWFTSPKEINQYQYIEQTQIQTQYQAQGQITIVGTRETKSVQVEISGVTNIQVFAVTNGVTNY